MYLVLFHELKLIRVVLKLLFFSLLHDVITEVLLLFIVVGEHSMSEGSH